MARNKSFRGKGYQSNSTASKEKEESFNITRKKILICYRCSKIGHIKKFWQTKLNKDNVAETRKVVNEED